MLVWRLDRWGRSVTDLLATLQELEHLGVGFPADRNGLADHAGREGHGGAWPSSPSSNERFCGNGPGLAWRMRGRTAKNGRPATAAVHAAEIRKLYRAGISKSEIARRLKIGRTSVRRILAADSSQK